MDVGAGLKAVAIEKRQVPTVEDEQFGRWGDTPSALEGCWATT